jgi:recombination protein RecA
MEQNPEAATKIETLVRQKLNEGTEVTANTVKPLAAAASAKSAMENSAETKGANAAA